jgi:hypothetical protein
VRLQLSHSLLKRRYPLAQVGDAVHLGNRTGPKVG